MGKQPTLLVAYKAYDHATASQLPAGFASCEMGQEVRLHGSNLKPLMSAFGGIADMAVSKRHVCF